MNKKVMSLLSLILIFTMLLGTTVYASTDGAPKNPFKSGKKASEISNLEASIDDAGASIASLIRTIGNYVVFFVFLIFGITWAATKNSSKRVELKERAGHIAIGALIFFGAWQIFWFFYKLVNSLLSTIGN